MKRLLRRAAIACLSIAASSAFAAFVPGSVLVFRVGDGSSALSSAATPAFIDMYQADGTLLATYPLPTAVNGSNRRLTVTGTSTNEGVISLSADGQYVIIPGYDADVGTAAVSGTASATVNRVVGRLDVNFNIDTTTALNTAFNASNVRSATSSDGTGFWVSGTSTATTGGVWYIALGALGGTQIVTTPNNARAVSIFAGQLYGSSGSGTFVNVYTIGSGLPTVAGQSATSLAGMPTTGASPNGFFFSGPNTLYVADTATTLQKWQLSGGTWVKNTSFLPSLGPPTVFNVAGYAGASANTVFFTNGTTLYKVTDDGVNPNPTATAVVTAAANTAFRGLVAIPTVTPSFTVGNSPAVAHIGEVVQLIYAISNSNATDASVSFNDPLPSGTVPNALGATTTCPGGSAAVASNAVVFSATIPAFTGCTVSAYINVTVSGLKNRTVTLNSSLGNPPPAEAGLSVYPYGDFNYGFSDLLWRNSTDGSIQQWLMQGTTVLQVSSFGAPGTTRQPKFLADFNGDGAADILWQDADGSTWLSLVLGNSIATDTMLVGAGTGWSVTQVGDFNGDGMADLVWTHTDGSMQIWLMNGSTATSAASFVPAGTGWRVIKLADLNGDGMADIIWQHTDGRVQAWLMNGLAPITLGSFVGAGTGWTVSLVGDLDGDGMQDLVWTNTDGSAQAWTMNGLAVNQLASWVSPGTGYVPTMLGDLDGDGMQDVMWLYTRDGTVIAWLMDVGLRAKSVASFTGSGNQYTISHAMDFDGDGKMDLMWKAPDGTTQQWLMDGLVVRSAVTLTGPGPYAVVPPMP